MTSVTMRQMLEAGVHFGHQTRPLAGRRIAVIIKLVRIDADGPSFGAAKSRSTTPATFAMTS